MKNKIDQKEFIDYMWKLFPEQNQLPQRRGMMKEWGLWAGDQEELKERDGMIQAQEFLSNK